MTMDPFRPLKDVPAGQPEDRVAKLLREAAESHERNDFDRRRTWAHIADSLEDKPKRAWRWQTVSLVLLPAALCAVFLVKMQLRPSGLRELQIADVGTLAFSEAAALRLEEPNVEIPATCVVERRVYLDNGRVDARVDHRQKSHPFVVVTPQVRVVVVGTKFSVSVVDGKTTVQVSEGRVRVERNDPTLQSVFVSGGETIASDDARLLARAKPVETLPSAQALEDVSDNFAPTGDECDAENDSEKRRSCYHGHSEGSDLAAQNALLSWALYEERHGNISHALNVWKEYERRFAQGVFAPEVHLKKISTLLKLKNSDDALTETEQFLRLYPNHERISQVRRLKQDLETSLKPRPLPAPPPVP